MPMHLNFIAAVRTEKFHWGGGMLSRFLFPCIALGAKIR
jgi:hypothetical protein